jgi:hypothetical protein
MVHTDELDNGDFENGRWTNEDPNKCDECANARNCSTKFFYAGREYADPPNHCECGHVTMGSLIGTTAAKEEAEAGRIPHSKICTDHWIAYMDNIIDEENARQN